MHIPSDWTFKSAGIAASFDAHVREQLPWYDLATGAVAHIARHYIPDGGLVYDVGASTGNIGRALSETLTARNATLIGIEPSADMCERYAGPGRVINADAISFEFDNFDVGICFLVLMFMPATKRKAFIRRMVDKINPGGAMIVFDKTVIHGGYISTIMHRLTIAGKIAQGANPSDVIAKELSLGGVQRPLPSRFMDFSVPEAIEVFRFGEFAGWVIERPE